MPSRTSTPAARSGIDSVSFWEPMPMTARRDSVRRRSGGNWPAREWCAKHPASFRWREVKYRLNFRALRDLVFVPHFGGLFTVCGLVPTSTATHQSEG